VSIPGRRAGRALRVLLVLSCAAMLLAGGPRAQAHGEAVEVVVEGLARGGEGLGVVDYGIAITFVDGDPMSGADVEISIEPDEQVAVDPVSETVPGVYIGRVQFPDVGERRVIISFDSPDSSGSVEFTQVVRESAPEAPLVMVDTLDPDRVGTVATESTSILGGGSESPQVGEHRFPVIVEAFIETAEAPLIIDYAAVIAGADSPILRLSARSDQGDVLEPVELVDTGGVHRTRVEYPTAALWTVTLSLETAAGDETATFPENLPWPHYTTEAGQPKVKYDSERPDRIGTISDEDTSVYLMETAGGGDQASPSTSRPEVEEPPVTESAPSPSPEGAGDDVVANVTEPADELWLDVGLRVLHVTALLVWVVPLFASVLGREHRFSVAAALGGMGMTAVTGVWLALWGAPVTFPGLLRWEELASRLYGDAYLIAFLAKMAMALVAFVATIVWASRRSKISVFVTFGALAAAVVAVTAMSQFHLFSHL